MRARVRTYKEKEVDDLVAELCHMLSTCDDFKIVAKMKEIVPEFVSNNSIFTKLDDQKVQHVEIAN
jgi:hypothetical protein